MSLMEKLGLPPGKFKNFGSLLQIKLRTKENCQLQKFLDPPLQNYPVGNEFEGFPLHFKIRCVCFFHTPNVKQNTENPYDL